MLRFFRLLTLASLVGLLPGAMAGQEPPVEENPEGLANYAYTHDLGFGGYDAGEQQVVNLRIPGGYLLRSTEDHRWGLRLLFPISFGVYGLTLDDFLGAPEFDLDRIKVVTIVPAAEFLIPLSQRWTLKPRQDLGVGKDFEGGDYILIAATRIQGVYTRP